MLIPYCVHSWVISSPLALDQVSTLMDPVVLSPVQTSALSAHSEICCIFDMTNLAKIGALHFASTSPYSNCFFLGLPHFQKWYQLCRNPAECIPHLSTSRFPTSPDPSLTDSLQCPQLPTPDPRWWLWSAHYAAARIIS